MREGCNCNDNKEDPSTWTIDKIHGRECRGVQEQTLQKCMKIEEVDAKKITIYKNKLICRKPLGESINWLRGQWVDEKTG